MKYDITIRTIIQEIKEVYDKKGIILSEQEIFNMCNLQFKVLHFGMNKGVNVRLPIFGSFRRKRLDTIIQNNLEMSKLRDVMSKNEFSKTVLEAKIRQAKLRISRKKKEQKIQTLEELKELNDFKFRIFPLEKIMKDE